MSNSFSKWLNKYPLLKNGFPIVVCSLVASTVTVAVRQLGGFESFSLKTYDWMVRLRPPELMDSRLLTVLITEEDIQTEGKWPISDATLAKAVQILLQDNPYGIGIDLYRDLPVEPGNQELSNIFADTDRISVVCKLESERQPAVAAPPDLPEDLVGFADIVVDSDGVVRRNLFYVEPQVSRCPTPASLGLQMAFNYLIGIGVEPEQTEDGLLKLGDAVLEPISRNMGMYQNIDASGYQILLDYRANQEPTPIVTLNDVLEGRVNAGLIEEKIILIGVSAPSLKDTFTTPYSSQNGDFVLMPGVVLHAQMASQILSLALNRHSLIWSWNEWGEIGWVYLWGLLGSASILLISRPILMVALQVGGIALIVGIGVVIFVGEGGWIPMVAPAVAFITGAIALAIYNAYQAKQEQLAIQKQVDEQEKSIAMLKMMVNMHSDLDSPASVSSYEQGFKLVNRYEIIEPLGKGSFGSTYLARDLQRPGKPYCVIKRLTPSSRDPKFLKIVQRLFRTEAKILEKVGQHQQIPQLLAYIEQDQQFFLIQEYIEGKTLIKELYSKERYTEREALSLIEKIMNILGFIEQYNLIHRDIKPDNVIRRKSDNSIVLIDFGAVKQISRHKNENKTVVIGNDGYAAPEQLAGQPVMASDIYATGMMAIHCLTGNFPGNFPKDPTTGDLIWNSYEYVSKPTARIINKMIRYHFSDRYQNADEVLHDLRKLKRKIIALQNKAS